KFCRGSTKTCGCFSNMLSVGSRVTKDNESIFSYTAREGSMTLDPVSTGDPGWEEFLDPYNEFSVKYNAIPLFNQSPQLTPEQAKRTLGPQIKELQEFRRKYDPTDRL